MLRQFRRGDVDQLYPLLQRHFPGENELLGFRPEAFHEIVRKIFRPHIQLLMALANMVRRPFAKFFVIETDGHLAATTLLTFTPTTGYVSMVMVDDPYRRRGYAKRLLETAAKESRRAGRSWVVLDVLSDNAPAKHLYDEIGYRTVASMTFQTADFAGPIPTGPAPPLPTGIRPLARGDGDRLTEISNEERPAEYRKILPAYPRQFFVSPLVAMGLESDTEAWVIDRGQGAEGFVRATTSPATEAGNLTAPLIGPDVPPELAQQLVGYAVDWVRRRKVTRVATEIPEHAVRGLAALTSVGFTPKLHAETMALPLHA
jgi:ribosomal protein S18 acetylase RimI-like enzyme